MTASAPDTDAGGSGSTTGKGRDDQVEHFVATVTMDPMMDKETAVVSIRNKHNNFLRGGVGFATIPTGRARARGVNGRARVFHLPI